ncbi:MAG TPA: hypothetical protein VL984_06285 [Acidimicrobiales bacterium]|nr:hypothetical protein [Acidimicrobiales bacterium]
MLTRSRFARVVPKYTQREDTHADTDRDLQLARDLLLCSSRHPRTAT